MLKIFTGLYKGRKLKSVPGPAVRPTTAKVKLSFFDTMQNEIRETIFLDGFAGTGNIGIEALSRGADYVVFIDELGEAINGLQHNLEKIGVPQDKYRIIKGDYNRTVIHLGKEGYKFDIIFLDPPYQLLEYANPLKVIYKRGILKEDGIVILERPVRLKFESKFFERYRTQRLGSKCLDYFCYPGAAGEVTDQQADQELEEPDDTYDTYDTYETNEEDEVEETGEKEETDET